MGNGRIRGGRGQRRASESADRSEPCAVRTIGHGRVHAVAANLRNRSPGRIRRDARSVFRRFPAQKGVAADRGKRQSLEFLSRSAEAESDECAEQSIGGGVIAKSFAEMREAIHVTGPEDEATTQLEWIPSNLVL